ncbi:MAG TPA: aldo/keto reductase [Microbacteriaceae bacterium]|jgi:D-threo-aldose 1-dehydrogenase|nr:aldo/keto reductase [Microbacteriaceae bacterium]
MRIRATRRGLPLTELGLGVAQFGNLYRETTDADSTAAVDTAWESGIRYFDTAPHYGLGLSERRLGAALASRPRDEFVVSSKVGRVLEPSPETAHLTDGEGFVVPASLKRVWDFSRDGILRSVEATLKRTGLDRIDVLYLHDPDDHWAEACTTGIGALIELREQGLVRAVGAGMNQSAALAELIRVADIDLVMVAGRFTLLEQGALDDLLPIASERGVGVVVAGVYNSGLLSRDRPASDAKYNYEQAPAEVIARATRIAEICESHGVTLPAAALAYPLLHPAVVSVVVGARDPRQVAGSVERYLTPIPEELWSDLRSAGLLPTSFLTGRHR